MDPRVRHARTMGKIVIVAIAIVLVWTTYYKSTRPLTPLEQKVQTELRSHETPDRYSDGAWSVRGLLGVENLTPGDAFMVRGIVVKPVEPCTCPEGAQCKPCGPAGITLADRLNPLGKTVFVITRAGEESLFKKGVRIALQMRVSANSSNGNPIFETF